MPGRNIAFRDATRTVAAAEIRRRKVMMVRTDGLRIRKIRLLQTTDPSESRFNIVFETGRVFYREQIANHDRVHWSILVGIPVSKKFSAFSSLWLGRLSMELRPVCSNEYGFTRSASSDVSALCMQPGRVGISFGFSGLSRSNTVKREI